MPASWSKWQRWHAVKCPNCGVIHDLTAFDYLIRPDNQKPVFACEFMKDGIDIGCGKKFQVVAVDNPVLVRVRLEHDDAGEFKHVQTEAERREFEQSEVWREMQKKKPRT